MRLFFGYETDIIKHTEECGWTND